MDWLQRHLLNHFDIATESGRSWMSLAEALLRIPDKPTADALIKDHLGWHPPFIRAVIKLMARQFVMAETIEKAIHNAQKTKRLYSFDMLGESARTESQAVAYLKAYTDVIHATGRNAHHAGPIQSSGVSIKLSALYPRFEALKRKSGFGILFERIRQLAILAKSYDIGITLDAEECDRLEYQLALFEALLQDEALSNWDGLGIAVQAYQKRSLNVIEQLASWCHQYHRNIMVRLVKGAYWDTEIKRAQVLGLDDYPVYTQKHETDASYIACVKVLWQHRDVMYPQFGTHNTDTIKELKLLTAEDVEMQQLYGMVSDRHARIYAPIGTYEDLLPYLIRRLIENGANTSFLKQQRKRTALPSAKLIPLPRDLYSPFRTNSRGDDVTDFATLENIEKAIQKHLTSIADAPLPHMTASDLPFESAMVAYRQWVKRPVNERADILRKAADLLEQHRYLFFAWLIKEAKKTLPDAISEVREAVDYCRYYAEQAERLMSIPVILPGPIGESNQLTYRGRGVVVCISPWNFPLAIFTGQIMGALVTGNAVLAKPAHQTTQIAHAAVNLFYQAGVPRDVLQLVIGAGSAIGNALVSDQRVAGLIFTGSFDTARRINQALAQKPGPIVPLIAETGGQNAMIVDSSALLEQVVQDTLQSAFNAAGQRCSALRVICIQDDIAEKFIALLKGAMLLLTVGDPLDPNTDVGPVIEQDAKVALDQYIADLKTGKAKWVFGVDIPAQGNYVSPTVCEIDNLSILEGEVFGPILHLIRYPADARESMIDAIRQKGYGLTFGVQSRIKGRYEAMADAVRAGNVYVNRNMIGAVVGVQPFGGEGLSGTGPKAGGPNYLPRLVQEHVLTVNTAAMGGDLEIYT